MTRDNKRNPPRCWRKVPDKNGVMRPCMREGHPMRIHGSFGDSQQLLCTRCVDEVKAKGWQVESMTGSN